MSGHRRAKEDPFFGVEPLFFASGRPSFEAWKRLFSLHPASGSKAMFHQDLVGLTGLLVMGSGIAALVVETLRERFGFGEAWMGYGLLLVMSLHLFAMFACLIRRALALGFVSMASVTLPVVVILYFLPDSGRGGNPFLFLGEVLLIGILILGFLFSNEGRGVHRVNLVRRDLLDSLLPQVDYRKALEKRRVTERL